jgi:ABC-type amino acid transport substrate-binding protein
MDPLKENKDSTLKSKFPKKYYYWILPLFAIFFILLIVKGCSNGGIIKKKTFIVGRESVWQIELLGRERSLTGFTNDLLARIAEQNNIRFQWVEANPANLINGLDNRYFDFILTTLRPNVINQATYDFSELVFELGPVLIVRYEWQITSLKEMALKPIGIPYGMLTHFNALREPGVNVYDLSLVYYNNINRALEDLTHDQIDGVILKAIPAYATTLGLYAKKLKVVTPPLNDEGFRFVSLKSSELTDVINMVNQSINKMREDGTYKALIEKWSLIDAQTQYWQHEEQK